MDTLQELKMALNQISMSITSDYIPLTVDGKKIKSIKLTDDYRVEIKTEK